MDHAGPVENASKPSVAVSHEDCFPFFEDRALRPDPVGLKYTFPAQALGIKLTMSMAKKYAAESGQNVQKDEVSVLSEIGVDKFTIVVGSASWRRALRFFLNTDHGGFDSRWHTGDYSEYLSREMMVDVAAPLPQVNQDKAGEKFIQNWCLSVTDLLNATMRVTNIVLQVQAPVCFDRRSCDINIALDEVMLTISSALPRTLFGDEKSQFETIEFPNDPSDVIYNIYGPELNVSSLEISTFRCQQKVKGLSLQLIPLISTSAFALPQQRVLSTDVTMIFSFEAQRAEQSSNCSLGTIAVVVSMLVHRFEMNIDFDYFVSIGNTVSLQFSTETVDVPTTNVDPNERIVDTMAHRRLVQRLLRKHNIVTERFCTAFNLRIVESKIRHWRQNVSLRHALLLCQEGFNDATPCLLLWDGEMKEADICFEDDFSTGNGRVVLKLSIDAFGVRVCDFDGFFRANPGPIAQDLLTDTPMMILLSCDERDRTRSLACRIEETLGASLTWALSLELNNAAFSCPIDNLITLWFIWVDALFIPFPSNSRAKSKIRFPPGTLGHYVVSLMSDKSTAALSSLISKRTSRCGLAVTPAPSLKFSIERVVQSILTQGMLFPTDMLLVRCAMNDVTFHFEAKKFNDPQDDSFNFGLTLLEFEFLASNFLSEASTIFKSFDVLVHRKEKWSSKITSQSKGLRHSLRSRLTLLANGSRNPKSGRSSESNCSDKYENESDCSDNYEFGYSYENSNISLSIPENVVLGHMLALRDWFESFQRITEQYIPSWGRFKDNRAVTDQTEVIRALNYLHHACSSTNTSLRELQARHESLQNKFNGYHRLSQKIGIDKDLEIASLRALVFVKEKERFSALSLVSSEASGWLGVGSANVSGQRGLLSSMVWQHWVVLRHSSLLLFGAPGQVGMRRNGVLMLCRILIISYFPFVLQYGMVDFVALEGATMRELTGEKRHADLKRAFSIVELSGTTHFFVAGNDADFVNWVVAIQRAINLFSVASPDVENSVPVGNESIPYNLGQDGDIVVSQENGITTPLNQSLTTPVETVRMDQSDFGRSNQSDGRNGLDGFEPTAGNSIDVAVDSLCGTIDVDVPVSNVAPRGQDWRREQVRNRFVGVSQATKSRFGSAMSAARQKGKEVAQKGKAMAQKRLDGTTSSFDVRKNEGSTIHGESKSCPSCPLLNTGLDVKSQICALKRSDANSDEHETTRRLGKNGSLLGISTDVLSSSNLPLQSDQVVCDEPKPVPSNSEPDEFTSIGAKTENGVLDQNNADDFDDRTESDRPVGMKQRIGAVVRRAIAQSDNQRLLNGRLGTKLDSSDVFTNGAIESVKLERISLSRALSTPFHPFGKGDKGISGLELKCVEGVWTIRVEIVAPEFKRTANGVENDHLASEVTTGVAEPLGDKMEDDTGIASASTSSNADFMYPVAGKDDTLSQVKCLDHTTTKSTRLSQYFRIQVFEHKSDLTISPVELQKSLSEILQFHSSMSESIAKVSSHQFSPDAMTGNPFQPCTHGDIAKAAGLSALETVCISGSLLGECFENSKSTENYSCKSLLTH